MSLMDFISGVSLLSDRDIKKLIDENRLRIDPLDYHAINSASIDLRLGSILVRYPPQTIKIGTDIPISQEIDMTESSYRLCPREFILGATKEEINMPDGYQGAIETKGNIARAGIQIHNNDGHVDAGFCGHITLEIVNMNKSDVYVELIPDIPICQLFIVKLSSDCDSLYKGKYLNQVKPTIYYP